MPRHERIDIDALAAQRPAAPHSIASMLEQADAALDAARATQVHDSTEHAKAECLPDEFARRKRWSNAKVRWPNELAALRGWYAALDRTRGKSLTSAILRVAQLGTVIQSSGRPEPDFDRDPHVAAVEKALLALADDGARLLVWTYLELVPAHGGKSKKQEETEARQPRRGKRRTERPEAGASAQAIAFGVKQGSCGLPKGSFLRVGEATASMLVAETLGLLKGDSEGWAAIAEQVAERTSRARKALQRALAAVECDCGCRWIIPDVKREPGVQIEVECCSGIEVVRGVRSPCRTRLVSGPANAHPSASWVRCGVCGKPVGGA